MLGYTNNTWLEFPLPSDSEIGKEFWLPFNRNEEAGSVNKNPTVNFFCYDARRFDNNKCFCLVPVDQTGDSGILEELLILGRDFMAKEGLKSCFILNGYNGNWFSINETELGFRITELKGYLT